VLVTYNFAEAELVTAAVTSLIFNNRLRNNKNLASFVT